MTLSKRQDRERKALINILIYEVELEYNTNIYKVIKLRNALKQVTTDPKTYFDDLDKEE